MTQDGIFRALNMRIDELQKQIVYLYEVNPMSPFPMSKETTNMYANGKIVAHEHEIEFIQKLLKLWTQ